MEDYEAYGACMSNAPMIWQLMQLGIAALGPDGMQQLCYKVRAMLQ